ncbi:MAG: integrase core domain-containing protein, partial [Planctomycetota bacterium]|nr:integrase core domain-containing protein [Planctomycetota bacterium]
MTPDDLTAETAICILACASLIQRRLHRLIEFPNRQIAVLKRLIADGQHRPTNDERRQLARLTNDLDRHLLSMAETLVTPDTLQRWYRKLIAQTYSSHRRGRPRIHADLEALVVRLATENPNWGYATIADRAGELGWSVSKRCIGYVLRRHGIPPEPSRGNTDWGRFIEAHWPGLMAIDCATWEVPDPQGTSTSRHHALYAIRLATREVRLMGVTDDANGEWGTRCCRNLTAYEGDFTAGATRVIMDRDPMFIESAKECFRSIGCKVTITPLKSPKCNAYIERFIGTTRREVGRSIIPFSTEALRRTLAEHVDYSNHERTHQT